MLNVGLKDFGLKNENACLEGRKYKDKYAEYQKRYRSEYGVFPELDRKNNPFTALYDDVYYACKNLRRRGFYGALFYHDIHGFFNKRLKRIYNTYKKEWSFMIGTVANIRDTFFRFVNSAPGDYITNDLGFRIDENDNYYEGTWSDGKLVYGLIFFQKAKTFFVGEISYGDRTGSLPEYIGVLYSFNNNIHKKTLDTRMQIGKFFEKNGEIIPYAETVLTFDTSSKNDVMKHMEATVGNYEDGYEIGKFYFKNFSDGDPSIGSEIYKADGRKRERSFIYWGLHFVLGLYMFVYYVMKFTYILPFFLIYKLIQKKNWK